MASDSGPHLLICVWKCCYKVHTLNFLRVYEMWALHTATLPIHFFFIMKRIYL